MIYALLNPTNNIVSGCKNNIGNSNYSKNVLILLSKSNDNRDHSIHGTSIHGDSNIDTPRLGLFMGSVCTQLFCLPLVIESYTAVLTTYINGYKYDTILKALFVFICSILYCIFTIDGE